MTNAKAIKLAAGATIVTIAVTQTVRTRRNLKDVVTDTIAKLEQEFDAIEADMIIDQPK